MSKQSKYIRIFSSLTSLFFGRRPWVVSVPTSQLSPLLPCPAPDDRDAWHAYWTSLGQPWRTKPEIDTKRQEELSKSRAIVPDIEKGIYPFKGIELNRADIEWLLATHDSGLGPIDWSDESQRERKGLDLRGAILCHVDLSKLPLAAMQGGIGWYHGMLATSEQRETAAIHLERANLTETHLEGTDLSHGYMEGADFTKAYLGNAIFLDAHLKSADFIDACLERSELAGADLESAKLIRANLRGADLTEAHLENAIAWHANLEKANLWKACMDRVDLGWTNLKAANLLQAHLKGAELTNAHLEGAKLFGAHLECASLFEAHLEGTELTMAHLEGACLAGAFLDSATQLSSVILGNEMFGYVSLADIHWSDTNLTVLNWSAISILGDEPVTRSQKQHTGKAKAKDRRLDEYQTAMRANRQLAAALHNQGLNEDAARFAYRGQLMQRKVFRYQRQFVQYLGSLFLDLLSGYGYRVGRCFIAYALVIGVFATIYHLLGTHPAWNEAVVISMTAFHGRGFFPDQFHPGDPQALAAAIEAFVGLLIEITLIGTLTQRLFGK